MPAKMTAVVLLELLMKMDESSSLKLFPRDTAVEGPASLQCSLV